MAELMFQNLGDAIQKGYKIGTENRVARETEQRQNQLRDLASRAYAAPSQDRQGLIQQAVAVDPEAGLALGGKLEQREIDHSARAGNVANAMLRAFQSKNPAQIQGTYQAVKPYFQELSPGTALPEQADETMLPMLYQLQAAAGGTTASEELKSLRIGGNGNYWAIQGGQLVDTGVPAAADNQLVKGEGGYFGVNPRTLSAAPVNIGGAASGLPASGVQFTVDPSLPPQVQQAIVQQETAAGGSQRPWTANTPDPYGGNHGGALLNQPGGQLRPEQEAPSGYQYAPGGGLVPIPGGPADKPALTPADLAKDEQAMRKEVNALVAEPRSVLVSYDKVRNAASNPSAANDLALIFAYMKMLDPGSVVREGEFANAQNAAGIPDRVWNAYNNALKGERLNDDQRRQFVQSADQVASSARNQLDSVAKRYQETARQYGYDPERATGFTDFSDVQSSTNSGQSQQAARPTTEAEYNALPSGALFIDPDDGKTYRKR